MNNSIYNCRRYKVVEEYINGRLERVFEGRPKTIWDALEKTIDSHPNVESFICKDRRLTFQDLGIRSKNVAISLQREFGVKKGDRIALLLGTDLEYPITVLGATKVGGVVVPLNSRFTGEELTFEINNSDSSILIVDQEYWERIEPHRSAFKSIKHIFVNGNEIPEDTMPFTLLTNEKTGSVNDIEINENDPIFIMYTSGTTGYPKGAIQYHRGVIQTSMLIDDVFQATPGNDRMLNVLPLFHAAGLIMSTISSIYMGISCVYLRNYKTVDVLATIESEKITLMIQVPTVLALMLNHSNFEKFDLQYLRAIIVGGAPKTAEMVKLIRKRLPGVNLTDTYGMTETHTMDCILLDEELESHLESVGKIVPIEDIKIVKESGEECSPNISGEIMIKGSKTIRCYWNRPEDTSGLIADDWLHTGDIGRVDEQGYVFVVDRIKDLINRGGQKISSVEVENVLASHPKVAEAAVLGIPDAFFGEEAKAFLVLKQTVEIREDEIRDHCKNHLADYKIPKYFEFVNDLPRNSAGKVMKEVLRRR